MIEGSLFTKVINDETPLAFFPKNLHHMFLNTPPSVTIKWNIDLLWFASIILKPALGLIL